MGPYTATYLHPQGPGDSRPTALQIIHDQTLERKLVGKVIVISGTSSGLGVATARALFATGATLFLTTRNIKNTETTLAEILEPSRVSLIEMDNSSFTSIRNAAENILAKSNHQVNILINNAGHLGSFEDLQLSTDGHEMHFATNHLGHFLLFQLLKRALISSSTPEFQSRVLNVASSSHRESGINESDNYNFQKGGYNCIRAYAQSKMANIYMANELERRYGRLGLHAISLHPGMIATNLSRNMGPGFVKQFTEDEKLSKQLRSPEQGAATTVIAAIGKEWEGKGGRYLEDCEEASRGKEDNDALGFGFVDRTYDQEKEGRLWKDSLEIVGIQDDIC